MKDRFVEIKKRTIKLEVDDNLLVPSKIEEKYLKIIKIKDLKQDKNLYVKEVTYSVYSNISYNNLVNSLIRDKYSESEEFAILRKAMTLKTDEFTEYNAYVEECKVKAKEWINQRDGI